MPKSFRIRKINVRKRSTKRGKTSRTRQTRRTPRTSAIKENKAVLSTLRKAFGEVKLADILMELKHLVVQDKKLSALLFLAKSLPMDGSDAQFGRYQETLVTGLLRMKKCLAFQFNFNALMLSLHNKVIPLISALSNASGKKTQRGGANFMQLLTAIIVYVFLIQVLVQAQYQQSKETEAEMERSQMVPIDFSQVDKLHPTSITVHGKEFEFLKTTIMENPMHTCSVRDEETEEKCMRTITESLDIDFRNTAAIKSKKLSKTVVREFFGTSVDDLLTTFNRGSAELNKHMKQTCERIVELEERDVPSPIVWNHQKMYDALKAKLDYANREKQRRYIETLRQKEAEEKRELARLEQESKNKEIKSTAKSTLLSLFGKTPVDIVPVEMKSTATLPAPVDYATRVPERLLEHDNAHVATLNEELNEGITQTEMNALMMDMAKKGLCEKGKCPTAQDSQEVYNLLMEEVVKIQPEYQKTARERNKKAYFDKLCKKTFEMPVMAAFNKTGNSMDVYLPTNWYMIRIVLANMVHHLLQDYPILINKELTLVDLSNKVNVRLKGLYELSVVFLKIIGDFEEKMIDTYQLTPATSAELKVASIQIFDSIDKSLTELSYMDFPLSKKYTAEQESIYQQKREATQQTRAHKEESVKDTSTHYFNMVSSAITPAKEAAVSGLYGLGDILDATLVNTLGIPMKFADYFGNKLLNVVLKFSSVFVFLILVYKYGLLSKIASATNVILEKGTARLTRKRRSSASMPSEVPLEPLVPPKMGRLTLRERINVYKNYLALLSFRGELDERMRRLEILRDTDPQLYQALTSPGSIPSLLANEVPLETSSQPLLLPPSIPESISNAVSTVGNVIQRSIPISRKRAPPPPKPNMPIEYYMNEPYGEEYFKDHILPVRPETWEPPKGYTWTLVTVDGNRGWALSKKRF